MARSARGRAAREHLKGLMITFGLRLSSIMGCWIQVETWGPESPAQPREPPAGATSTWSFMVTLAGKSQGPCQRDVLGFPFLSHIALYCSGVRVGLLFQSAFASEMLSTPKALNQLF